MFLFISLYFTILFKSIVTIIHKLFSNHIQLWWEWQSKGKYYTPNEHLNCLVISQNLPQSINYSYWILLYIIIYRHRKFSISLFIRILIENVYRLKVKGWFSTVNYIRIYYVWYLSEEKSQIDQLNEKRFNLYFYSSSSFWQITIPNSYKSCQ